MLLIFMTTPMVYNFLWKLTCQVIDLKWNVLVASHWYTASNIANNVNLRWQIKY